MKLMYYQVHAWFSHKKIWSPLSETMQCLTTISHGQGEVFDKLESTLGLAFSLWPARLSLQGPLLKGVTLHSRLYFHPQPGSRSWPIKFSCLTSWLHWKFGLDPWLSSINHAHWVLGEALTISKVLLIPCLTVWPAQNFHLDRFDPGHGWEYSHLCSSVPPPLVLSRFLLFPS